MTNESGTFSSAFPHASFADPINSRIVETEIFGGVSLADLVAGTQLEVQTENRSYHVQYCGEDLAWISGHPVFCPEPVLVSIHGSTWGGAMIKRSYIGRGMHLEFRLPRQQTITTSRIIEIRECEPALNEGKWPNAGIS